MAQNGTWCGCRFLVARPLSADLFIRAKELFLEAKCLSKDSNFWIAALAQNFRPLNFVHEEAASNPVRAALDKLLKTFFQGACRA